MQAGQGWQAQLDDSKQGLVDLQTVSQAAICSPYSAIPSLLLQGPRGTQFVLPACTQHALL